MAREVHRVAEGRERRVLGAANEWDVEYDGIHYHVTATLEEITPLTAREYLDHNYEGNRKKSKTRINRYKNVMGRRRWRLTHEGIAFDEDGKLIDGQHRLEGVVESGEPIPCLVVRGLPTEVYEALGRPMMRRIDDVANEEWITSRTVAIGRILLLGVRAGSGIDVAGLDEDRLLQGIREYADGIQFAEQHHHNKIVTAPVLGVVARAYYTADRDRLAEFLHVLQTNEPQHAQDDQAALRLRRYITDETNGSGSYKARAQLYLLTQSALVSFLARQTSPKLVPAEREHFPLPGAKTEPTPVTPLSAAREARKAMPGAKPAPKGARKAGRA